MNETTSPGSSRKYLTAFFLSEAFFFSFAFTLIHIVHIIQSPSFLTIGCPDFIARVAALAGPRLRAVATQTFLFLLLHFGQRRIRHNLLQINAFAGSRKVKIRKRSKICPNDFHRKYRSHLQQQRQKEQLLVENSFLVFFLFNQAMSSYLPRISQTTFRGTFFHDSVSFLVQPLLEEMMLQFRLLLLSCIGKSKRDDLDLI